MKGCLGRIINCLKPQASIDGVESLRTVGFLGLRVLGLRVEGLGFRALLSLFLSSWVQALGFDMAVLNGATIMIIGIVSSLKLSASLPVSFPKPQTLNPKPQTPNPKTPNPKPQTQNLPKTPNPPQTLNPKPQTPNPKPPQNPKP